MHFWETYYESEISPQFKDTCDEIFGHFAKEYDPWLLLDYRAYALCTGVMNLDNKAAKVAGDRWAR